MTRKRDGERERVSLKQYKWKDTQAQESESRTKTRNAKSRSPIFYALSLSLSLSLSLILPQCFTLPKHSHSWLRTSKHMHAQTHTLALVQLCTRADTIAHLWTWKVVVKSWRRRHQAVHNPTTTIRQKHEPMHGTSSNTCQATMLSDKTDRDQRYPTDIFLPRSLFRRRCFFQRYYRKFFFGVWDWPSKSLWPSRGRDYRIMVTVIRGGMCCCYDSTGQCPWYRTGPSTDRGKFASRRWIQLVILRRDWVVCLTWDGSLEIDAGTFRRYHVLSCWSLSNREINVCSNQPINVKEAVYKKLGCNRMVGEGIKQSLPYKIA